MLGFGKKSEQFVGRKEITLAEIVDKYDIIDVKPTHMLITEQSTELAESPSFAEIGSTGSTAYGRMIRHDYNPLLSGFSGLQQFDKMRKSDGQVKSTMRLLKTPILAARWYMEPASNRPKDIMIANYMWSCLTKWSTVSWPQFLNEALLMCDFGAYAFEKVFAYNPEPQFRGKIIWQKFAPRSPFNWSDWDYDSHGGPVNLKYLGTPGDSGAEVPISINKLLVFTHDKEAGNMDGVSVLRSAYKHWYYKENLYKVDAIQKERHGIGIPIIKLPPNFTPEDRQLADEMGSNLRTNERSHIVLPPFWEVMMLDIRSNPVDCLPSIEHHNGEIQKNILGQFLEKNADDADIFIKSTRSIAEVIRDVFNKYAIPQLVNYNWENITDYPELKFRRIGETQDWRTLSFSIRNFVGSGIIVPDDVLEKWIRDELDMPMPDIATRREVATPQNPGASDDEDTKGSKDDPNELDLPRQSTANKMKQQAQGAGKSNVGTDSSGK